LSLRRRARRIAHGIALATLAIAVLGSPWAFGAVQASWERWIYLCLGISAAGWGVMLAVGDPHRPRLPGAFWGVIGLILIGLFQLIPLSPAKVKYLSPRVASLREELCEPVDTEAAIAISGANVSEKQTLSLDPYATKRQLPHWIMAALALLLGANLFSNSRLRMGLLIAIMSNGAAIVAFGIVQKLTWNEMIYWRVPLTHGGRPLGPFVNSNNAAGYILACMGAAIALIWLARERAAESNEYSSLRYRSSSSYSRRSFLPTAAQIHSLVEPRFLWVFTIMSLLIAGIFVSLSRGGALAMLLTGVLLLPMEIATRKQTRAGIWFVAFVALAFTLLLWVGLNGEVAARLSSLLDGKTVSTDSRWQAWAAAWASISDFQWRGSGMGTFRYVYPLHMKVDFAVQYIHAENFLIEIFTELGIAGLLCVSVVWLSLARHAWRMLSCRSDALIAAFGMGFLFAALSVSFASLGDFGLYIPSNMLLFCVLGGSTCFVKLDGRTGLHGRHSREGKATVLLRCLSIGIAGVSIVAAAWSFMHLNRVAMNDAILKEARAVVAAQSAYEKEEGETVILLEELEAASEKSPDSLDLHQAIVGLDFLQYRRVEYQFLLEAGRPAVEATWLETRLSVTHQLFYTFQAFQENPAFREMGFEDTNAVKRESLEVQDHLVPSYERLLKSRHANPMVPSVHTRIALLRPIINESNWDSAESDLQRAAMLGPANSALQFDCGVIAYQAEMKDLAYECWRRSLELTWRYPSREPKLLAPMLWYCAGDLDDPSAASRMLPKSPQRILTLQARYFSNPDPGYIQIRDSLFTVIRDLESDPDVSPEEAAYGLARVVLAEGDLDASARHFAKAVRLNPTEASWQHEFARVLDQMGEFEQSYEYAKRAYRLSPRPSYKNFMEEVDEKIRARRLNGSSAPSGEGE
jgi:tetratricopeptide (TPR) repeat protein